MDEKTKARYLGDIEYFNAKLQMDKASMLFLPLASAYLNLEKYDEAKQVLFDGLDANPDLSVAKTLLAQAYIGLKQYEDAKGLLTEIRVIDSANYLAEKLLGDIYREESDYKKAIISYRNAYSAAPEDGELKDLIQSMISESGMDEHELLDDRPMGIDEEELLESLGQELAEEVRQEIGVVKQTTASDEEVRQTVDEIVGTSDEDSLDIYAEEDASSDSVEMEEESLASIDDEIVPTKSIIDFEDMTSDDSDEEDEEEISGAEADIADMAAELSEDFGLDVPLEDSREAEPQADAAEDESADALDNFGMDDIPEQQKQDDAENEFDISSIMGGDAFSASDDIVGGQPENEEFPDISEMQDSADIGEIGGFEAEEFAAEPEGTDDGAADSESFPHEAETADEIITHDGAAVPVIDALSEEIGFSDDEMQMMQDELAENTAENTAEDTLGGFMDEAVEPDEIYNMSAEDEKIISEAKAELTREEKINDELAILFAMEELEERARQGGDKEYVSSAADDILADVKSRYPEGLDNETYEQVSRLENLLEIIKNNAK